MFDFLKRRKAQIILEHADNFDLRNNFYMIGRATIDENKFLKRKKWFVLVGLKIAIIDNIMSSSISRKHGEFIWNDNTYCYKDVGSSCGSKINGIPLRPGQEYLLKSGDKILLGGVLELVYII